MHADPAVTSRQSAASSGGGADSDDDPPSSAPRIGAERVGPDSTASSDGIVWIDRRPPGSEAAGIEVDLAGLVGKARALAVHLTPPVAEVAIALLDDAEMDRLHREHCGVAGTTDVLSYPDPEADPSRGLVGDLAIGVEVAARESMARGRSIEAEILLYAAHGLLHLAGERDDTVESAARMREAQDRIMRALGLPATEEKPSA